MGAWLTTKLAAMLQGQNSPHCKDVISTVLLSLLQSNSAVLNGRPTTALKGTANIRTTCKLPFTFHT